MATPVDSDYPRAPTCTEEVGRCWKNGSSSQADYLLRKTDYTSDVGRALPCLRPPLGQLAGMPYGKRPSSAKGGKQAYMCKVFWWQVPSTVIIQVPTRSGDGSPHPSTPKPGTLKEHAINVQEGWKPYPLTLFLYGWANAPRNEGTRVEAHNQCGHDNDT